MREGREIFEAGGVRYDFRNDGERKSAKIVRFGRKIALQTAWLSGFGAFFAKILLKLEFSEENPLIFGSAEAGSEGEERDIFRLLFE